MENNITPKNPTQFSLHNGIAKELLFYQVLSINPEMIPLLEVTGYSN